jgi:hypothetical protein
MAGGPMEILVIMQTLQKMALFLPILVMEFLLTGVHYVLLAMVMDEITIYNYMALATINCFSAIEVQILVKVVGNEYRLSQAGDLPIPIVLVLEEQILAMYIMFIK